MNYHSTYIFKIGNDMIKDLKRKAKKALKKSNLSQVLACIEMGISVPTYKNVINEAVLPLDNDKRESIEEWIITQLKKD